MQTELIMYNPQVVISTDQTYTDAKRINDICHTAGIAFVKAEVRGVFASVFCDFGEQFPVLDVDGEFPSYPYTSFGSFRFHPKSLKLAIRLCGYAYMETHNKELENEIKL